MAPKRKQKRTPRRVNVRFREKGEKAFAVGYTKNISAGGLFIGTIRPLPPGTEIVVEIKEVEEVRRRPAAVVHSARVSPLLASVRTSGMGVRFLDTQEVGELAAQGSEVDQEPTAQLVAETEPVGAERSGLTRLQIDLSDIESFREAFRRDIQHGLVFVTNPGDVDLGEEVLVGIRVPGRGEAIPLRARVDRETVCRSEAYGEPGAAGFMLIFSEGDRAVSQLRAFL